MPLKLNAPLCLTIAFIIHSQRKHCQSKSFLVRQRRDFRHLPLKIRTKMRRKKLFMMHIKNVILSGRALRNQIVQFSKVLIQRIRMRNQLQRKKYVGCVLILIRILFHYINRMRNADTQLCCIASMLFCTLAYLGVEIQEPRRRSIVTAH